MSRVMATVVFSLCMVVSISSFAAVDYYVFNYSAMGCIEDPDYSGADYTAWGLTNDGGSSTYVYCPINYLQTLYDGSQITYDAPTDTSWVKVEVYDNNNSVDLQCRIYGSDAYDTDSSGQFDYDYTPYEVASNGSPDTLIFDPDADLSNDRGSYMFIYCRIPAVYNTENSYIMGYSLMIDP